MSIFGPREDDPLLQGDPLAQFPDDGSPNEASSSDEAASGDATPSDPLADRDHAPHTPESEGPASPTRSETSVPEGQSVFGPSYDGGGGVSHPMDDCVIVRPVEQAADGRLSALNAALDEGWRLRRVELRDVPPESAPQSSTTLSLAFVLYRPDS